MDRLAAALHCTRQHLPLITLRWGLLAVTLLLAARDLLQGQPFLPIFLATIFATILLVVWTVRLPSFAVPRRGVPVIIAGDLLLSWCAVWLAGGSGAALVPFALGALVLPGALGGWPGAAVAWMAAAALDLLWRALGPSSAHPPLLLDALRPALAAALWPLSAALDRRWPLARWRTTTITSVPLLTASEPPPAATATTFSLRELSDPPARRGLEHPPSATLERRATKLQAVLRQVIAEAHGLQVTFQVVGREGPLPPSHTQLISRALEIALDNVRQHAHTEQVNVQLYQTPQQVTLLVRDYGTGLLDGTAEPPGFHQLKLLRYRLDELGGSLAITEPDDRGVLLTFTLPISLVTN